MPQQVVDGGRASGCVVILHKVMGTQEGQVRGGSGSLVRRERRPRALTRDRKMGMLSGCWEGKSRRWPGGLWAQRGAQTFDLWDTSKVSSHSRHQKGP